MCVLAFFLTQQSSRFTCIKPSRYEVVPEINLYKAELLDCLPFLSQFYCTYTLLNGLCLCIAYEAHY